MEAASWRNNNTFVSFYLRDLSQMGDVTTAGPFVAGQKVIYCWPETEIERPDRCWLLSHCFHCPEPGDTVSNGTLSHQDGTRQISEQKTPLYIQSKVPLEFSLDVLC